MSYLKIREDHKNGKMTRIEFWEAMKNKHQNLIDAHELLSKTELKAIEIRKNEILVVTDDGVRMIWDPSEVRSVPSVLVNYEKHEEDIAKHLLKASEGKDVVFDIGANYGFYAMHFAQRINTSGVIHAFEPIRSTFDILLKNLEHNRHLASRVVPHCLGLGASEHTAVFYYPEYSGSGAASQRELHPHEKNNIVEARINTLDRMYKCANLRKLDLLKIDVEGAELFVLQGGIETINHHKPIIFAEMLRKWAKPFGYHPNEVIQLLKQIGYECWTFFDGQIIPFATMDEETTQTNFMFTHPKYHQKLYA